MSNDVNNKGVLILDTPAVISATNTFKIRKLVLISGATACDATLEDGAGDLIAQLSCPAESADEIDWNANSQVSKGLELASIAGTGAVVYVYCG